MMRLKGEGYTSIANELSMNVSTVRMYCIRNQLTDNDLKDVSVCVHCGAEITQPKKGGKKIFCSEKCRSAWRRAVGRHKETVYHHICKRCGKEFDTVGNKNQIYCSSYCYHSHHKGSET